MELMYESGGGGVGLGGGEQRSKSPRGTYLSSKDSRHLKGFKWRRKWPALSSLVNNRVMENENPREASVY